MKKLKQKFNDNINKVESGCWEWNKYLNRDGYGGFKYLGQQLAHRVSFILHVGPIPEGGLICHKCDNPSCVNPDHLFLGTQKDNMKDCSNKDRLNHRNKDKTHCIRNHEFTEENTRFSKNGERQCKECGRIGLRRRRKAKKDELNNEQ